MGWKAFGCSLLGPVSYAFGGCREAYKEAGEVGWTEWLIGIGEMVGGGALAIFGTIELGEAIVFQGGSTFGLALGGAMIGGGGFLLADGNFRSSIAGYTWDDSFNLLKGAGEMTGGLALLPMGINSLYETYNGQNFSYFELGLGLVGVGGGGYLLYDGYNRVNEAISPWVIVETKITDNVVNYGKPGERTDLQRTQLTKKDKSGKETSLSIKEEQEECKKRGYIWVDGQKKGQTAGCYKKGDAKLALEYNQTVENYYDINNDNWDLSEKNIGDIERMTAGKRTCKDWAIMYRMNFQQTGPKMAFMLPFDCQKAFAQGKNPNFVPSSINPF